ncbi:hypothetical protein [Agromyces sp. Soil535]|uniref:hypothetical protein n=1 Tax=Agromyces sp. Soil535 TaxID=1736390 RepID=UPI0012E3CDBE|nr:hypothetical protein [Agromyces sp. Soil535]
MAVDFLSLDSGDGWWGSREWPSIVEGFVARLDDPADPFWEIKGAREALANAPTEVKDRDALSEALLEAPWTLSTEVCSWLIRVGIGYVRFDRRED